MKIISKSIPQSPQIFDVDYPIVKVTCRIGQTTIAQYSVNLEEMPDQSISDRFNFVLTAARSANPDFFDLTIESPLPVKLLEIHVSNLTHIKLNQSAVHSEAIAAT